MSKRETRKLQEMLVRSVLTGQPLPGSARPVSLPDLAFIDRQPVVFLDDENVAGALALDALPKPLRVVSRETIQAEAQSQGEVAYLHFEPPLVSGREVTLTLQGKIVSRHLGMAGLSSIQVKFRKRGEEWEVAGEPVYSAA